MNEEYDIDKAWSDFCIDGDINNLNNEKLSENSNFAPKATEIYISTKTKIAYLSTEIELNDIFWAIKILPYHIQAEGIVKKQMKFNFSNQEKVDEVSNIIKDEKNVDEHIISRIINPTGRITFRDIRKISIGLCKKDILSYRSKKKSAFYNCFVLILRINIEEEFKEIHIKVFNTGKLEIPGIRDDKVLKYSLDLLTSILSKYSKKIITCNHNYETVLINSNFNCGYYIDRDKLLDILKYKYKIDCIFDSCQYPGIQCKYSITRNNIDYQLSFMIFRTGSILIVGKCSEEVLYDVYNYIKDILEEQYPHVHVNTVIENKVVLKNKKKKERRRTILIKT